MSMQQARRINRLESQVERMASIVEQQARSHADLAYRVAVLTEKLSDVENKRRGGRPRKLSPVSENGAGEPAQSGGN